MASRKNKYVVSPHQDIPGVWQATFPGGQVALFDEDDYGLFLSRNWSCTRTDGKSFYLYARGRGEKSGVIDYFHRLVMGNPAGKKVDHINRNTLDNRRDNLRVCSDAESARNQGPRTGGYKGVSRNGRGWAATIWVDYQRRHLGTFPTPEEAAQAYDVAAAQLHGSFAYLNFPPK